jgi:hypothetical protein
MKELSFRSGYKLLLIIYDFRAEGLFLIDMLH